MFSCARGRFHLQIKATCRCGTQTADQRASEIRDFLLFIAYGFLNRFSVALTGHERQQQELHRYSMCFKEAGGSIVITTDCQLSVES